MSLVVFTLIFVIAIVIVFFSITGQQFGIKALTDLGWQSSLILAAVFIAVFIFILARGLGKASGKI